MFKMETKHAGILISLLIINIIYCNNEKDNEEENGVQNIRDKEILTKRSEDDFINIGSITNDTCTVDKTLTIEYGEVNVICGEIYHLAGFEMAPVVHPNRANVNKHYTLMMVDPDAPSSKDPKYRSWLHWLIVNIKDADISTGFEVAEYNPPTPPPGSGLHRYVFLLVEQTEPHTHYFPVKKRGSFDVNKYAKDQKLGNLAGLSLFQTEHK